MPDIVQHVALAIYTEFVRERDPQRALQRFNRMPDATREQFENEAKAALRVADAYYRGAHAA